MFRSRESRRVFCQVLVERFVTVFSVLAILNFVVFLGVAAHLGGDAVNGKIEAGRYYLWGWNAHTGTKSYTEVTPAVFEYSRMHVYSIFITWPIMFVGSLALRARGRPRRVTRGGA